MAARRAPLAVEVKGTASPDIAWAQLKVSSIASHGLITSGEAAVYRVCDVYSAVPRVYILRHGEDFQLVPEARWAFKSTVRSVPHHSSVQPAGPPAPSAPGAHRARPSRYDPLEMFLQEQQGNEVVLRLADGPGLMSLTFPPSAFTHQAYWANQMDTKNRPHARAWQRAGFRVEAVHLDGDHSWVRFSRR